MMWAALIVILSKYVAAAYVLSDPTTDSRRGE